MDSKDTNGFLFKMIGWPTLAIVAVLILLEYILKSELVSTSAVLFSFLEFNGKNPALTVFLYAAILSMVKVIITPSTYTQIQDEKNRIIEKRIEKKLDDAQDDFNLIEARELNRLQVQAEYRQLTRKIILMIPESISAVLIVVFTIWLGYYTGEVMTTTTMTLPWGTVESDKWILFSYQINGTTSIYYSTPLLVYYANMMLVFTVVYRSLFKHIFTVFRLKDLDGKPNNRV